MLTTEHRTPHRPHTSLRSHAQPLPLWHSYFRLMHESPQA
jgi:hypothetical protein